MAILEKGRLRVLVDPRWRESVEAKDIPYLDRLIPDVRERARADPDETFSHLLTLQAGLLTADSGQDISDRPDLLRLAERFVPA